MALAATHPAGLEVQFSSDGTTWQTLEAHDAGALVRTRRFAGAPGVATVARYWRVVWVGDDDLEAAVARVADVRFWRETAELSNHRRWSFDFDAGEQRYSLIATDGNIEVYRRSQRVASIPSPYGHEVVRAVKRAASRDTLLAFHKTVPPFRFSRQGGHAEWDCRELTLTNVPIYDYTGERAGGVNEVQQLTFTDYEAGETFNITLEGETTGAIAYNTSMPTLAASVQAALEALDNIGDGGVTVASPADKTLTVTFVGENRADDLAEMAPATLSSVQGGVRVATVTQGRPGGEPVISATRGWPSCGVFFEQRLWLGGLASRPQTLLASRLGQFFDFQTRGADADKAIDVTLDTDESTEVLALFPGRHLQVFTASGMFFCPVTPITPPPPFVRSSKEGVEPGTPLLDLDGDALFIQAGAGTVAQAAFNDSLLRYETVALSAFHSHLVDGMAAAGARRGRSTTEPTLVLFVLEDGAAVEMHALLKQDVLGFSAWETDGAFTEAGGELGGDLFVCVRRVADGLETHRLERVDEGRLLDGSVLQEGPGDMIDGLGHLEGRTVCLYIDGADAGNAVVTGGQVTLPYPALRTREAGLLFTPRGVLLPMIMEGDPRAGLARRARVGEIQFNLGPTANLWAGMAGKTLWRVGLKTRGPEGGPPRALLDHGPGEDAFQGWARVYPVPGFQTDSQIEFAQLRPGPLEIREVAATVTT